MHMKFHMKSGLIKQELLFLHVPRSLEAESFWLWFKCRVLKTVLPVYPCRDTLLYTCSYIVKKTNTQEPPPTKKNPKTVLLLGICTEYVLYEQSIFNPPMEDEEKQIKEYNSSEISSIDFKPVTYESQSEIIGCVDFKLLIHRR